MEIKEWTYEEYPEFNEEVPGAELIETTGDETGVFYFNDVEYANMDGMPLHLQILKPYTRKTGFIKPLPCIVFVQGSAWMKQDVYMHLPLMSRLAERGYVVACAEYRHSEIAPFPAPIIDAKNAVRFLKINAEKYGIEADKMIIGGDSSGGHTAVFAALRQNDESDENLFPGVSAEVRGVLDFYGSVTAMLDDGFPSTPNHHMPDSPEGMEMGGVNLKEHPDLCRMMSAECNIFPDTKIPPVLIFHGTKDKIINTKQSVSLYRRLTECGKDARLYLVKGADHGGAEFWSGQVLDAVECFIKKLF